jgi:hypothetical protein
VKGKAVRVHAMKTYGGVEGVDPLIFKPRNWMEVSGHLHAPTALHLAKAPPYPLNRRLDGPQRWSGRFGNEKNVLPPPAIELRFVSCPARSLVIDLFVAKLITLQIDLLVERLAVLH